jgi:hypothetical protein
MSGGSIGEQHNADDRQLVVFTFSGPLDQNAVKAWNEAIGPLMEQFGNSVAAVTIEGALSPTLMRRTEHNKKKLGL